LRVDEDMVIKGYKEACDVDGVEEESSTFLGGDAGRRVLDMMSVQATERR